MLKAFTSFIATEGLIAPGQKVLLAVSGGADSMCMASLFLQAGISVGIAHCNFGLRGVESDGDEYFVREWAAQHEVIFYSRYFKTDEYARNNGLSIQMAARELRYNFFEEIRSQHGYDLIATAHHLDDAVETFFINLIRGTGISGIRGIKAKSARLIRPLLFTTRSQIEAFLAEEGLKYRNDQSNEKDDYLRNRLRHKVIPELLHLEPHFAQTMRDNFRRFSQAESLYRRKLQEISRQVVSVQGDRIQLSKKALIHLEDPLLFLFEYLRDYGFNAETCRDVIAGLHGEPGRIFLSPTHRLLSDRTYLLLQASTPLTMDTQSEYRIGEEDRVFNGPVSLDIKWTTIGPDFSPPAAAHIACLDAGRLQFPLILRKWRRGDVFHPLGARGAKKLSDFFTDHKFSLFDKENCWLLVSGDSIVWVLGHRIAHPVRITKQSNRAIQLTLTGH